jgi:hypothetical protein
MMREVGHGQGHCEHAKNAIMCAMDHNKYDLVVLTFVNY